MLTTELINHSVPRLKAEDSISRALQLLSDYNASHLPVVLEDKYLGMISEDDLMDAEDDRLPLSVLDEHFLRLAVKENEHFLNAVNYSNLHDSNMIPIVAEEGELVGTITAGDLLKALGNFAGGNEIGGIIVMEMERSQFAISEISRIVESNNATILHLNTTVQSETGLLTVTLHINKKEIATIVATFERYEYDVIYFFGDEHFENEIHSNYRHLMNYLDI
jgi:acetoin utilization protein AcuB